MSHLKTFIIAIFLAFLAVPVLAGEVEEEIRDLIKGQAEAWNEGDIEAFMGLYWNSDELRFASGAIVTYGWEDTLDSHQRRYNTPEKMGKLAFKIQEVRVLSVTHTLVFGEWRVDRDVADLKGLFTLLFEKREGGWKIIADHTSEDALPLAVVSE